MTPTIVCPPRMMRWARQWLTSTVPAIPAGTLFYDANDRLSTDVYDNDGNTVSSGSIGNVYDFENHLVQHGAVTIVYDGDGNRVAKTAGGVTTSYLVDTNSTTRYAQVLEELSGSTVTRKYTYGLSLISENQLIGSTTTVSFYGFDGHGSVRQITDRNGAVTDTYTYDAFGNVLTTTGSTPNNFKFAGEQFDPDLGLYYNRARYLDVRQGRFWGMDMYEGDVFDPQSLHKYVFCGESPINCQDRNGHDFDLGSLSAAIGDFGSIASRAILQTGAVLSNLYAELGPALPLFVEKTFFVLNAGILALQLIGGAPSALERLSQNLQSYDGQFSPAPFPRGFSVGKASGQNLGDGFKVFDDFDFDTGEGTQIFSTNQIQTQEQLISAIRVKASQFNNGFNSRDIFSGPDSTGKFVQFTKEEVTQRNLFVVTPPNSNFSLTRIATQLEQLEVEFGIDKILVEESQAFPH